MSSKTETLHPITNQLERGEIVEACRKIGISKHAAWAILRGKQQKGKPYLLAALKGIIKEREKRVAELSGV